MTSYNAPAQTVLSSSGDKYVTDNNGYELSFSNILWKLSDTKYMAVSPTIQIELAGQDSASAEGFVEFTYLEEGIVQLVTKDQAWQVLAAGSSLNLANGMSIYLDTQEIVGGSGSARLTLAGINADGPSNIKIAASDEWVPPTFNITAIDGEDGESGDQGRTVNRDRQEAKAHPEIPVRMESPEKMVRPELPELPAEAEITVLLPLADLPQPCRP